MKDGEKLVFKTITWLLEVDRSVKAVGGSGVDVVLRGMSDELVYTMIANGLRIVPKQEDS